MLAVSSVVFAISLVCLHQLTALPQPFSSMLSTLPNPALWLPGVVLLVVPSAWPRGLSSFARMFACGLGAVAAACMWMLPQAQQGLEARLPAACHGLKLQGQWVLNAQTQLPDKQVWLASPNTNTLTPVGKLPAGCSLPLRIRQVRLTAELALVQNLQVHAGDAFTAQLKLQSTRALMNFHGFDAEGHWFAEGVDALGVVEQVQHITPASAWSALLHAPARLRAALTHGVQDRLQGHPQQGLVLALITGDQGLIDPDQRALYNQTGIAHLVAISGLHIQLLVMLAAALGARLWRCSARACLALPAPVAGLYLGLLVGLYYGLVTGWQVPAQRTVLMQAWLCMMQQRGWKSSTWQAWHVALLLVCVQDPWAVQSASLYLSFGAVALLMLANQGVVDYRGQQRSEGWLSLAHRIGLSTLKAQYTATMGLIPLTAYYFHQISLVGPWVNVLSIPWMSYLATPVALLGGAFNSPVLLQLAADSLQLQEHLLKPLQGHGWTAWPVAAQPLWVYALAGLGALVLVIPRGIVHRAWGLLLLCTLAWPAPRPAQGEFWMTALDVGQGTAVWIQTQNHHLVYDTGAAFSPRSDMGRRVIAPTLLAHGTEQLDALWVSHDDSDHSGGAAHLLRTLNVGQWVSPLPEHHPLSQLAQQRGVAVQPCPTGQRFEWDGVEFEALSAADLRFATPLLSPLTGDNNHSCLLSIRTGPHRVLLTGDIETPAEHALVNAAAHNPEVALALKSSVLMAPHHGSSTSSTPAFLALVQAQHVFVQSGWKNRFGHPTAQVIQRYRDLGLEVTQTAQNGALHWRFSPQQPHPKTISARQTRVRYWSVHEVGAF